MIERYLPTFLRGWRAANPGIELRLEDGGGPELAGKLDGSAIRVPTPNVSAVDLTFVAGKDVTVADVNEIVREAAMGKMSAVLAYDPEPKVSIDFNHTPQSSIFAPDQTKVVGGRTVRVLAWYDNEWGFSCRMADVAAAMGRLLG